MATIIIITPPPPPPPEEQENRSVTPINPLDSKAYEIDDELAKEFGQYLRKRIAENE